MEARIRIKRWSVRSARSRQTQCWRCVGRAFRRPRTDFHRGLLAATRLNHAGWRAFWGGNWIHPRSPHEGSLGHRRFFTWRSRRGRADPDKIEEKDAAPIETDTACSRGEFDAGRVFWLRSEDQDAGLPPLPIAPDSTVLSGCAETTEHAHRPIFRVLIGWKGVVKIPSRRFAIASAALFEVLERLVIVAHIG